MSTRIFPRLATYIATLIVGALFAGSLAACSADQATNCSPDALTNDTTSVARLWNEALLSAIRRDFPAPTIHARNLFHLSAAMWDAWAAFDDDATGYFVDQAVVLETDAVAAARQTAISVAAFVLLSHRYENSIGGTESLTEFDDLFTQLCSGLNSLGLSEAAPDSPAGIGHHIASTIIEFGLTDGSLEQSGYLDFSYEPVNAPLVVAEPWTPMIDPDRWQPLVLNVQVTQNDLELPSTVQTYVGPHWGYVTGFALDPVDPDGDGQPIDPGPPPFEGSTEFGDAALEVIRRSSLLADDSPINIGPAARGNNSLGTDDGQGYRRNPVTNAPYEEVISTVADFHRVIAEFWADGPDSETPPGHWNTLANNLDFNADQRLIGGTGEPVDQLEWDVKLYFALNGATHDGAIAAWGTKAAYDYARPISMIRHLSSIGELPLQPGLSEVVTAESAAAGQRHEHLQEHIGEIAVRAWLRPGVAEAGQGTVGWLLGTEWVPYQRDTFVTPAFAGYVSGHSVFSRAAAEVLAAFTGSEFFPGGLGTWTVEAGQLDFEPGPTNDVVLQWATYFDAADQAGQSRLWGGIHVPVDDFNGRVMGSAIGKAAWTLAQTYYD